MKRQLGEHLSSSHLPKQVTGSNSLQVPWFNPPYMDATMEPSPTLQENGIMRYRCSWCPRCVPEEDRWCTDLRIYYKVTCPTTGWFYGWTGMCETCVDHEWKEYRREYAVEKIEDMKHFVCQRVLVAWCEELTHRLQSSMQTAVHLEYDGSGGKQKARRRLQQLRAAAY